MSRRRRGVFLLRIRCPRAPLRSRPSGQLHVAFSRFPSAASVGVLVTQEQLEKCNGHLSVLNIVMRGVIADFIDAPFAAPRPRRDVEEAMLLRDDGDEEGGGAASDGDRDSEGDGSDTEPRVRAPAKCAGSGDDSDASSDTTISLHSTDSLRLRRARRLALMKPKKGHLSISAMRVRAGEEVAKLIAAYRHRIACTEADPAAPLPEGS